MTKKTKKAVILLSGGLDSATTLAIAKSRGFECLAVSFSYNQRHSIELRSAKKVARFFAVREHKTITIDSGVFSNSALTDKTIKVPLGRSIDPKKIPITYVPAETQFS
jgi:7-cyano-7-deazaguanine synthase